MGRLYVGTPRKGKGADGRLLCFLLVGATVRQFLIILGLIGAFAVTGLLVGFALSAGPLVELLTMGWFGAAGILLAHFLAGIIQDRK